MTLSNPNVKVSYVGNGANTTFAITPDLVQEGNSVIKVYLRDTTQDPVTSTLQVEGSDYEIVGDNVEFYTAPLSTDVVVIARQLEFTQTLDLIENGEWSNDAGELAFDRIVAMVQQLSEKLERAPKIGITEQIDELEIPEPEPSTLLGFNDSADAIRLYNITDLATSVSGSLTDHINDPSGAHAASAISVVATGNLTSTDVQAALEELQAEIDGFVGGGAPTNASYVTLGTNGTLTDERVLTGTTNQITFTDSGPGGTVTASTPQDIATSSSPTFNNLILSNELRVLESGGPSYVGLASPSLAANTVYTLPTAFPAVSGYVLTSTTLGVMSWAAAISDLTAFDTDDLSEGTTNLYFTSERVDDRVAALIQNGTGLTWTYNDGANTLTGNVSLSAFSTSNLSEGSNLYYTDERVDDRVAVLIQNGTGISWSYNDGANTLTPTVSLSAFSTTNLSEGSNLYYTDERVDDRVAVLIQNGTGISWSYNDASGTLTPTVSLSAFSTTNLAEGSNLYFTDERAQDAVGTILTDSSKIDFTYNDAGNTITATIVAGSLVNADISTSAAIDFSKLATLTSGNVIYGVTNVATSTALNTIAVTALTGTSNQITVSASVGSVTLSTPQNIHTGASPTFAGLTLSGLSTGIVHSSVAGVLSSSLIVDADVSSSAAIARSKIATGTADHVVINSGTGAFSSEAQLAVSRGGTNLGIYSIGDTLYASGTTTLTRIPIGASGTIFRSNGTSPAWATLSTAGIATNTPSYVTLATTTDLTNERVLTGTSNQITLTDNGAGSTVVLSTPQNIHTGATPTFSGLTLSGLTSTGVLYNSSGLIKTESAFTYDETNDILYVPEVAGGSTTSSSLMVSAYSNAFADTNTGRIQFMERMTFGISWTATGSAGVLSDALLKFSGTLTTALAINILPAVQDSRTVRYSTSQTVSAFSTFIANTIYQPTTAVTDSVAYTQFAGFVARVQYAPDIAAGTATTDALIGYCAAPMTRKINAGTVAITSITGFGTYITPLILSNDIENATVTNLYHFRAANPLAGSVTLTNNIAVYVPALNLGTNRYGYYSDLASSATYWSIYSTGSAQSGHAGLFKFGAVTAPAVMVDINGGLAINSSGSTTTLTADNQVVTVSNRSYIRLSSDNATATNRTFVLTQGLANGQILVLEWTHATNRGELVDDSAVNGGGNHRLSATWSPDQNDVLKLIWNGTDWVELGRSAN